MNSLCLRDEHVTRFQDPSSRLKVIPRVLSGRPRRVPIARNESLGRRSAAAYASDRGTVSGKSSSKNTPVVFPVLSLPFVKARTVTSPFGRGSLLVERSFIRVPSPAKGVRRGVCVRVSETPTVLW